MGNCTSRKYAKIETIDFPDEFFTHFKREEHKGKLDPALTKVHSFQNSFVKQNPNTVIGADLNVSRPLFSKMRQETEQKFWSNWKETAEKCDVQVVEADRDEGLPGDSWVIRPKGYEGGPMACLVYAHGGGSVMWEPEDQICTFRQVALWWNCCVVIPKYRLAPEAKAPAGSCDFMDAFLYFHDNASDYNIDPNRMAIAGFSGGALIALGALRKMIDSKDISKVKTCFLQEPMISGDLLNLDPEHFTQPEAQNDIQTKLIWVYQQICQNYEQQVERKHLDVFPAQMIEDELKQLPMMFMMTSEFDVHRRDAVMFAKRLERVGKLAGIADTAGVDHGWSLCGNVPKTQNFYLEWKSAFEAYTKSQ